jgi:hypothetical protein
VTESTPQPPVPTGGKPPAKSRIRERLEGLIAEYGVVAIITYFTIFFGTWTGFAMAIRFGVDVEGVAAGAGTIGAAYVATKLTQPLRIGATLVATPIVARVWHRFRPPAAKVVAVSEGKPADDPDADADAPR